MMQVVHLSLLRKVLYGTVLQERVALLHREEHVLMRLRLVRHITLKSKVIQMVMHVHLVMKKLLQVVLILN